MTEDEVLLSHASDLKMQCADESTVLCTAFLDMRQRTLLTVLEKEQSEYVKTFYYGGFVRFLFRAFMSRMLPLSFLRRIRSMTP